MAWQTPKTDWRAADGVSNNDMNRIEGNIAYINEQIPSLPSAEYTIYVNGDTGSDSTGNGTQSAPFETIMKAVNTASKLGNGCNVNINISPTTYNEDVTIKHFANTVTILGSTSAATIKSLYVADATLMVHIPLITAEAIGVVVEHGGNLFMTSSLTCRNASSFGIYTLYNGIATFDNAVEFTNCAIGIHATQHSRLYANSIRGSVTAYGIVAASGSVVSYGTYNATGGARVLTNNGGRVVTGAQS